MGSSIKDQPIYVQSLKDRRYWRREDTACRVCQKYFNKYRRKHNCRVCGELVCDSCTEHKQLVVVKGRGLTTARVCFICVVECEAYEGSSAEQDDIPSYEYEEPNEHRHVVSPFTRNREQKPQIMSNTEQSSVSLPSTSSASDWGYPWPSPPKVPDELQRLRELYKLNILDSPPDDIFDIMCENVQQILETSVAAISFIDQERQWFKSRLGLLQTYIARHVSLCAPMLVTKMSIAIPDLKYDKQFQNNPLVTGAATIRFYASAPIISHGHVIGTVFVFDQFPRSPQSCDRARETLENVAISVELHLEDLMLTMIHQRPKDRRRSVTFAPEVQENRPSTVILEDDIQPRAPSTTILESPEAYQRNRRRDRPLDSIDTTVFGDFSEGTSYPNLDTFPPLTQIDDLNAEEEKTPDEPSPTQDLKVSKPSPTRENDTPSPIREANGNASSPTQEIKADALSPTRQSKGGSKEESPSDKTSARSVLEALETGEMSVRLLDLLSISARTQQQATKCCCLNDCIEKMSSKRPPLVVHSSRIHKEWMRYAAECIVCLKSFTLLRRRHHCHICGGIVCRGCSQHEKIIILPVMQVIHNARVCVTCLEDCDTNGAPIEMEVASSERSSSIDEDFGEVWNNPWPQPPVPLDEQARLTFLQQFEGFHEWYEFDKVCEMTASLLHVTVMAISIIDATHQHFQSKVGLLQPDISRHVSLCAHVIFAKEPIAVPDMRTDPIFNQNPMVTGSAHVRFYASVPLLSSTTNHVIGTVFVLDTETRSGAECDEAVRILEQVAHAVMPRLEAGSEDAAISTERNRSNVDDATAARIQAIMDMTAKTQAQVDHISLSQRGHSCTQKKQSVILDVTGFTKTRVCFACIVACTLPPAGSSIAERHQIHNDALVLAQNIQSPRESFSSTPKPTPVHNQLVPRGPTIRAENGAILRQSYVHITPKAWDYEHFGNNFIDTTRKTEHRGTVSIRYSDIISKNPAPIKLLESGGAATGEPAPEEETRNTLVLTSTPHNKEGVMLLNQQEVDSIKKPLPQPLQFVSSPTCVGPSDHHPTVAHLQHDMQYGYPLDFDWEFPWPKPPTVAFEKQRLDELYNFDILDGNQDDVLDIICDLAIQRLEAPFATVSFIDHDHQYFKASRGWRIADLPRNQSFCAHVLRIKSPLAVSDTLVDARFDQNPLVTGPHAIRSYLAAPILSPVSQLVLGTVFIMDTKARSFTNAQIDTIDRLAVAATSHIDSHKYNNESKKSAPTIAVARPTDNNNMATMLKGLLQKTAMTQQEVASRGSAMSHSSSEALEVE
ncbi:hypothetical protein THRCLA_00631 [Thraustotheca clavata]|uniref:FYVE-type domain-containing protein n=1 Tax=Thraustotheca clavata TaxID=74557 RepID=A0A1W0AAN9_9STRA|nr:hypothetical protein THRCLA_00631 [Thraustotheca clavata]